MDDKIVGSVYKVEDDVAALDIMPTRFKSSSKLDEKELALATFADKDPSFAAKAVAGEYQIVVAGTNFGGGGKTIEGPVFALRGSGIKIVIADSFARYFLRNAINNGFPILVCPGISQRVHTGDELRVDLKTAHIQNVTNGEEYVANPLSETAFNILTCGGLVGYAKKKLTQTN
jgi:3-isopropylmalate/(R)-2-methylmalate dehydratase small subunit